MVKLDRLNRQYDPEAAAARQLAWSERLRKAKEAVGAKQDAASRGPSAPPEISKAPELAAPPEEVTLRPPPKNLAALVTVISSGMDG